MLETFSSYNSFSFFITLSNYSNIIPVEINTENFQEIPSFSGINLLLDMSTINKNHRMLVEYEGKWEFDTFKVEGYDTDDLHIIDTTSGTELKLLKEENCKHDGICKVYILKNSYDLKKAIFKVPNPPTRDFYSFQIRYGKQEYYYKNILPSLALGFALSIPNIIIQIIRKIKGKNTSSCFSLSMNILLNFSYGFIIGRYIKIAGNNCLIIGFSLLGIFIVVLLGVILISWCDKFETILLGEIVFRELDTFQELKTLREIFNYCKKLPPKISFKAVGMHEESREVWKEYKEEFTEIHRTSVHENINGEISSYRSTEYFGRSKKLVGEHYSPWKRTEKGGEKMNSNYENKGKSFEKRIVQTWNKELDYKYGSWQDNTVLSDSLLKSNYLELIVNIDFELQFDKEAKEGIDKTKKDLINEGKKNDTDIISNEYIYCPDLPKIQKCYKDESAIAKVKELHASNQKKKKIFIIFWIISFFLGYSSIVELYLEPQKIIPKNISIKFIKLVSGKKKYRAEYMKKDENFDDKKDTQSNINKFGNIILDYDLEGVEENEKDEDEIMLELEKKLIKNTQN